jgi:hypothetical protein
MRGCRPDPIHFVAVIFSLRDGLGVAATSELDWGRGRRIWIGGAHRRGRRRSGGGARRLCGRCEVATVTGDGLLQGGGVVKVMV